MAHDIIDNRSEKLLEHVCRILPSTEYARFAVGYFFLSGFTAIREYLANLKETRLLIGNATDRETIEQIAEGYRRLEMAAEAVEAMQYPKSSDIKKSLETTAESLREGIALADQTDQDEHLILTLARLIEEGRLRVRVYTRGRLHAKAYIFDYGPVYDAQGRRLPREEKGIAIVGSSNLSLAALRHNTELNVLVHGNDNHAELTKWFDALWDEAEEFDETLLHELKESWAAARVSPHDIYLKTLYELVRDRLEGEERQIVLWDDEITSRLADFQQDAVKRALKIIKEYGGCFISDVVGLGKSYIGAAILKHLERTEDIRPLIICPASLTEMWERYNDIYHLNARVLSMAYLREGENGADLLNDERYQDRDFVLVDESHNFRYQDTQRYKILQHYLMMGRRCCFLTATPRNRSAWDVYNQIKLFHPDDRTVLPVDPPDLREYFKKIEKNERRLQDLLSHLLIRRTRKDILRWYGYDASTHAKVNPDEFREYLEGRRRAYVIVGGKRQFFPRRRLETITYSIEATYHGLYDRIRSCLGKPRKDPLSVPPVELTYARYGLWHYVNPSRRSKTPYHDLKTSGVNLRGLVRVLLFKRFESSVYAFCETVRRLLKIHRLFLRALEEGIVPAGDDAQALLYESDAFEERDLFDALREAAGRYTIEDFDLVLLKRHIQQDIDLLSEILGCVEKITPEKDAKLQELIRRLSTPPLNHGKCLIFTQYADTARYLAENLNPGGIRQDVEVIYSGDRSKARIIGRFAPRSNPEYACSNLPEINLLIATDVLAEGLNLQDCDKIVNYDLHWNPVRLIQRFGRIDRIGSEHDVIYGYNFLPETELEKNLGLKATLQNRIREIHETIGEDAAILDPSEKLNEEVMYAIYESRTGEFELYEGEQDSVVSLMEAEEMFQRMQKEQPEEFRRIAGMRDGIRTACRSGTKGIFVMCAAGRYRKLYLVDRDGREITTEIGRVLEAIRCEPDLPAEPLPPGYNAVVMTVKRRFLEELKHYRAMNTYGVSLSLAQRYVLRELRVLFNETKSDEVRARINLLEKAFRAPVTVAVRRELNLLRRNGVGGETLLKRLIEIYHNHKLGRMLDVPAAADKGEVLPRIICSEGLL